MREMEYYKANDCFAMSKDSQFTLIPDRFKTTATCYVLEDVYFRRMKSYGLCGTEGCPFYKTRRSHIRKK